MIDERFIIYNDNCLKVIAGMSSASIDNIFADLPYGNDTDYDAYKDSRENLIQLVNAFMPQALRVAKRVIITPGNSNQWLYPEPSWVLAFVNPAGVSRSAWGFSCWQPILAYGKDPYLATNRGCMPDTMVMRNSGDVDNDSGHPCPKPNNVMRWIIERTTIEGETVFDPFMGSGTTGVACMQLERKFIGCELSEKYFNIAKDRIEKAGLQPGLFSVKKAKTSKLDTPLLEGEPGWKRQELVIP